MPLRPPFLSRPSAIIVPLLVVLPLLIAFYSLTLGQDGNWDLRNYHWYNAYAFLTGRELVLDVAPAQVATYYNPTLDLPIYWLAQVLPARGVSFVLSFVQGLNLVPLTGLGWVLLAGLNPRSRALAAVALALACFLGGGQMGLLGTTFYDNVISLFVLGSAWLVVARAGDVWDGPGRRAFPVVFVAGLMVGGAVGLKQPTLPYAIGLCFAFLAVAGGFWRRMFLAFFFGIGVIAGMALFSGHWMWHLWSTYQNPLFPYFNDVFRSPWGVPEPYRDDKFLPHGVWNNLVFPYSWVTDPRKVGEILFTDLRVPVMYVVLLATPLLLAAGRLMGRRPAAGVPVRPALYVIVAGALTYLAWLKLFSIYRYLIPLEMLAPLVMVAAIGLWPLPARARGALVLALLVLVSVTARPGTWARMPFADRFVEVNVPALPDPDNTIVIQTGYAPTSFLAYGFPPQVPFLRVHSYFIHPDHGDILLNRRMRQRIDAHDGDFFWLVAHWEVWTADHILPAYGLVADMGDCRLVTSNLDEPMMLCRLRRSSAPQPEPAPEAVP
ncbi:hypothetical protein [Niveispirillum fermenti]|uniref:hypothetical protein n=1 Tax=Niveispirillum fermenti TaxID=1233113 RepID=UPI003A8C4518